MRKKPEFKLVELCLKIVPVSHYAYAVRFDKQQLFITHSAGAIEYITRFSAEW